MRSILIVRLSAIGDVIHTLPVLDALRAQLPEARIGWMVEELSAPLLENHPYLDKVYVIPKKRWRGHARSLFFKEIMPYFRAVRQDRWDATLDFQGLMKSALAAWGSGATLRVGHGGKNAREGSWLLNRQRVRRGPEDHHVVQQNLRLLEGLGLQVPKDPPRGTLGITNEETEEMRRRLREAGWQGEQLLAINPGAGWSSKRWPPAYFARLAAMLAERTGFKPLVLWGPGEEPMRDEIVAGLGVENCIAAPRTKVRELAVLISLCSLFVGGDTGPTHMAGLLEVPVLSIFGASTALRNQPWPSVGPKPAGVAVQRLELPCIGCWRRVCPLEGEAHLACLRGLSPERVLDDAGPWLETLTKRDRR